MSQRLTVTVCAFALIAIGATQEPSALPPRPKCPCDDPQLCEPVTQQHDKEVFGFIYPPSLSYKHYNWTHLSTVSRMWSGPAVDVDAGLVCDAHAAGARVVMSAAGVEEAMQNVSSRSLWVHRQIQAIQDACYDGINFDYERPVRLGSLALRQYTQLVQLMASSLHAVGKHYQVSVDVPWSPYDVDGRNYDWLAIAKAADLVFVMSYDMQSQIWGRCVASANSPPALVARGLRQWLDLGVPASKIVLGVPWYGYVYECARDAAGRTPPPDVDACLLAPSTFMGAPCSDAAGAQSDSRYLNKRLREGGNSTPVLWDPVQRAHRFNFVEERPRRALAGDSRTGRDRPGGDAGGAAPAAEQPRLLSEYALELEESGARRDAAGAAGPVGGARRSQVATLGGLPRGIAAGAVAAADAALLTADTSGPSTGGYLDPDGQMDGLERRPPGGGGATELVVHQVWFDNPESLREKYALARSLGLRGVGFWNLEQLAHGSTDPAVAAETAAMWEAVDAFAA